MEGAAMLIAAGALLGAIFGSFIAVIVLRWPQGRSAMQGRSACDGCGAPLRAIRLVPLLSYAAQRGRAACCGARIDRVHPVAELLGAFIGAVSAAVAPDLAHAVAGAVFGWLLLTLALLDLRHFWLPDRLTLVLALAGLAAAVIGIEPGLIDRMIGGAAGFMSLALVRWIYRRLRGREGLGGGDPKLFGAIGSWLGWHALPMVLLGAALVGLAAAMVLAIMGRRVGAMTRLPFGPMLAVAAWVLSIAASAEVTFFPI